MRRSGFASGHRQGRSRPARSKTEFGRGGRTEPSYVGIKIRCLNQLGDSPHGTRPAPCSLNCSSAGPARNGGDGPDRGNVRNHPGRASTAPAMLLGTIRSMPTFANKLLPNLSSGCCRMLQLPAAARTWDIILLQPPAAGRCTNLGASQAPVGKINRLGVLGQVGCEDVAVARGTQPVLMTTKRCAGSASGVSFSPMPSTKAWSPPTKMACRRPAWRPGPAAARAATCSPYSRFSASGARRVGAAAAAGPAPQGSLVKRRCRPGECRTACSAAPHAGDRSSARQRHAQIVAGQRAVPAQLKCSQSRTGQSARTPDCRW